MKQYRYYIFDFDGTLVDTEASLYDVYSYAFERIGLTCTREEASRFMHISLAETALIKEVPEKDKPLFAQAISDSLDFPSNLAKIKIFEDSDTVADLSRRGRMIGIASGNVEGHMHKVLAAHHLESLFSAVVGSDSFTHSKPDGEPCLVTMRRLGAIDPASCVYIGDSLQDVVCAFNAGIDGYLIDRRDECHDGKIRRIHSLRDLLK